MSDSFHQQAEQRVTAPDVQTVPEVQLVPDVQLVEVSSPENCAELAAVLARIWGLPDVSSVISPDALRAMAHSGCYVAGARLGDPHGGGLIGGGFGWPTRADGEWRLHSHVVGFLDGYRAMGLGRRIKHHQRDWVRVNGMQAVEWTYDPLVAANARFNLVKLGAQVTSFHRDFYGIMDDEFSARLGSDRLLVRWGVDDVSPDHEFVDDDRPALLSAGDDGEPIVNLTMATRTAARVSAQIPTDIVRIRRDNRERALQWTDAFAATVGQALLGGGRIVGITPERRYLVDR